MKYPVHNRVFTTRQPRLEADAPPPSPPKPTGWQRTKETLGAAWRTPGCLLLLTGNFAVAFGSSIVVPYLAVYLTREQHLGPAAVAAAITAKFWSQQGLTMLGGWIADRIGTVIAMCTGLLIRAMSYLVLVSVSGSVVVIGACVLLGFGGAMYIPASKAALVRMLGTGEMLRTVFALRSTANNAGNALGALTGSLLLLLANPRIGFFVTSLIFVVLATVLLRLRDFPAAEESADAATGQSADSLGAPAVRPTRRLAWILLCAFAFGFCYIQLEYALPVFTGSVQSLSFVGALFIINTAALVVLQVPLNQFTSRISSSAAVISGALLLMGIGFGVAASGSMGGLIACVLLYSIGEVLIDPRIDSEIAATVPTKRRGTAFGFVGTAFAAGGAAANGLAAAMSSDQGVMDHRFWLTLFALSVILSVIVFVSSLTKTCGAKSFTSS